MAIFKDKKRDDKDPNVAESTRALGDQTTDPGKEKSLPRSNPGEIASVPDAAGNLNLPDESEPSESGYRVAAGKSVTATTGELLDAGQEIHEKHVPGGDARLKELEAAGFIEKVRKGKPKSEISESGEALPPLHGIDGNQPPAQTPAEAGTPESGTKPGDKPSDQQPPVQKLGDEPSK